MVDINPTISIITLNVNGVNTPIKRQTLTEWIKKQGLREFSGGSVVKTPRFHCQGPGSIPGQGAKIPQATQCGQNKKDLTICCLQETHFKYKDTCKLRLRDEQTKHRGFLRQ